MKNSRHCNIRGTTEAANLLRLAADLMSSEEEDHPRVFLDRVKIEGHNVGASMHIHKGNSQSPSQPIEQLDQPCGINIYISNNIQGVSSSILLGSEVRMADPGLGLAFGDVSWDIEARERRGMGMDMGALRRLSSMFQVYYVPLVVCGFALFSIVLARFWPVNN